MTSDLQKEMRFGSLLVQLGLISQNDLQEATQLAVELGLPLGKVLVMSDFITEAELSALVQAQSMLKDQVVTLETAKQAFEIVLNKSVSWIDALRAVGWVEPHVMPANKLGKLLIDAGIIEASELQMALNSAEQSGLPLGRILSASGRITEPLLVSCLNAQVLLRDGKIDRQTAIKALRAAALRQTSVEQALIDAGQYKPAPRVRIKLGEMFVLAGLLSEEMIMDVIEHGLMSEEPIGQVLLKAGRITNKQLDAALQLQEMVDAGTLNPINSSEALRQVSTQHIDVEQAVANLGVQKEPALPKLTLADLLKLSGVLTEEDLAEAFQRATQNPALLIRILVMTGFVQESVLDVAVECQNMMKENILREDQAIIAINYCLRANCSLEQAVKDLGWLNNPRSTWKGKKRNAAQETAAQTAKQSLQFFE